MARSLLAALALTLVLAGPAGAATRPVSGSAPKDLHGFLLRADEAERHVFPRTPSFAWDPVPGAVRYEFQLSTSSVFREGGILYTDSTLTSPAASVPLSLPWITGSPYSLYARARAVLAKTITPWSAPFGFNLRWDSVPRPLPSYPGLLRWSPVEGARGYQVWFVDVPKMVVVNGNVVDEREFFTFHQGTQWISNVRWRVRALRVLENKTANGMPTVSYGPWSPVYNSVNPPFAVGSMSLTATISDVVAKGRSGDDAHRIMPGFAYTGTQSAFGAATELYRVYVFSDSDCVNPVYKGAVVGSPAYAPRPFGPLALPRTLASLTAARGTYLGDSADEGSQWSADFQSIKTTEAEKSPEPTTTVAGASGSSSQQSSGSSGSSSGGSSSSPNAPSTLPAAPPQIVLAPETKLGAPVDLWDVDWPRGGYYWTVIPVAAVQPPAITTSLAVVALSGATQIQVSSAIGFAVGDQISIGPVPGESVTIVGINGNTFTLSKALVAAHPPADPVARGTGSLEYRELEIPQETCAAGRVMRFGKSSEPALTSAAAPFASGLSPTGRLISASSRTPRFYGTPHVAWTPALGAWVYEIQWSKSAYPFRAEADPRTNTPGFLTISTSAVLPLKPGTWWYRVRGINWSLPTGAQRMSWSEPAKLIVARPQFRVVRGGR